MASVKKILKNIRKLRKKNDSYFARMRYVKYRDTLPIDDKTILLESEHGVKCNGNIFYLMRELVKPEYQDYSVYLSVVKSKEDEIRQFLNSKGLETIRIVPFCSDAYYRIIASAKYLINDTTFLPFFSKRKDQVYLNTWHGTPLKHMGRAYENAANSLGNVQRNFFLADYILAPNQLTESILRDDYMLPNLAHSRFVLEGYPRNEAFFDKSSRDRVREEMDFSSDLEVIAYLPTWREYTGFESIQSQSYLIYYLSEIDKRLNESQIMYVNLHPLAKRGVDVTSFKHIHPFPTEYETYEFLNACDCLVTDYSSVMFDFMITGRKTILFAYDADQYLASRGCYVDPREVGFPVASSLDELFDKLETEYEPADEDVLRRYAPYDGVNVSSELCHLLLDKDTSFSAERIHTIPDNGKKNVLVYSGNLARNGMTSSLRSLMSQVDKAKCNYILTMSQRLPDQNIVNLVDFVHMGLSYIPSFGRMNLTFKEKVAHFLFANKMMPFWLYKVLIGNAYVRDVERLYGNIRIDEVVHFTGYDYKRIMQFGAFDCPKSIFVHNNMIKEIREKKNSRRAVLRYAYRSYDHVALVSEDMIAPTSEIAGKNDNFVIVPNTFDYKSVIEKSTLPLSLDEFTRCNRSFEEIEMLIKSDNKKIINIGRYSPEKGHYRLIHAFGNILRKYPDCVLFIVGGTTNTSRQYSFDGLSEYVDTLNYADRVVLIENISNPYPLLKQCDGLILPSTHEGFGLVLLEADVLGLPTVATDIPGPQGFMRQHGGKLVPNTDEGVEEGLDYLFNNSGHTLGVDYDEYNRLAVDSFEAMLNL